MNDYENEVNKKNNDLEFPYLDVIPYAVMADKDLEFQKEKGGQLQPPSKFLQKNLYKKTNKGAVS